MDNKDFFLFGSVLFFIMPVSGMIREDRIMDGALLARFYAAKDKIYEAERRESVTRAQERCNLNKEKMRHKYGQLFQRMCEAKTPEELNALSSDDSRVLYIPPLLHKLAEKEECHELLEFMLSGGADANLRYTAEGGPPLFPLNHAICGGSSKNIHLLLHYGANIAWAISHEETRKVVMSHPTLQVLLGVAP